MPGRLPITDVVKGVGRSALRLVRIWCLYTVVVIAWLGSFSFSINTNCHLGIVPLTAARIYRAMFSGSVTSLLLLPLELLSL